MPLISCICFIEVILTISINGVTTLLQFDPVRHYVTSAAIGAHNEHGEDGEQGACSRRSKKRDKQDLPGPVRCVRFARI